MTSRRMFLAGAAGATTAAIASRVLARDGDGDTAVRIARAERSYSSLRYVLRIDGSDVGYLSSFEGGAISAPVVEGTVVGRYRKKQLGAVKYEDITIAFGMASSSLHRFVERAINGQSDSIDGEILGIDLEKKVRSRLLFFGAKIVKVAFPTLDGSAKKTASVELTLRPTLITNPSQSAGSPSGISSSSPTWLVSNFRMRIDGLPTTRVAKIEGLAFSLTHGVSSAVVDFPELSLLISDTDMPAWLDWHDSFVVQGQSADAYEKYGEIDLLDENLKKVLGRFYLNNLGIFRLSDVRDGTDRKRFRAELYCEYMDYEFRPDELDP